MTQFFFFLVKEEKVTGKMFFKGNIGWKRLYVTNVIIIVYENEWHNNDNDASFHFMVFVKVSFGKEREKERKKLKQTQKTFSKLNRNANQRKIRTKN